MILRTPSCFKYRLKKTSVTQSLNSPPVTNLKQPLLQMHIVYTPVRSHHITYFFQQSTVSHSDTTDILAQIILCCGGGRGAALCIAGYLAVSLGSTYQMRIAYTNCSEFVTMKNIFRHRQMSLGGPNCLWLKTTATDCKTLQNRGNIFVILVFLSQHSACSGYPVNFF